MFEFLLVNQQMPMQQQPQQPQPMQQPAQQQSMQQGSVQGSQTPVSSQPMAPTGDVQMGTIVTWAGAGGAASGAIQGVLSIVSGFDIINILMTVGIAVVLGILTAILIGQFGNKIPITATVMVKSAAMMFVLNLITGFIFGMGVGALGTILGIAGIGGGAFLYGWLLQKKIPNLM